MNIRKLIATITMSAALIAPLAACTGVDKAPTPAGASASTSTATNSPTPSLSQPSSTTAATSTPTSSADLTRAFPDRGTFVGAEDMPNMADLSLTHDQLPPSCSTDKKSFSDFDPSAHRVQFQSYVDTEAGGSIDFELIQDGTACGDSMYIFAQQIRGEDMDSLLLYKQNSSGDLELQKAVTVNGDDFIAARVDLEVGAEYTMVVIDVDQMDVAYVGWTQP